MRELKIGCVKVLGDQGLGMRAMERVFVIVVLRLECAREAPMSQAFRVVFL